MSEPTETPAAPEERTQGMEKVLAAFDANLKRKEEQLYDRLAVQLHDAAQPDRSQLAEIAGEQETVPALSAGRVRSPYRHLYQRLSDEQQYWRNEDSDHYMAQWIRGTSRPGQYQGIRAEAEAWLDHRYGRAPLLEGALTGTFGGTDGTGAEFLPIPLANLVYLARNKRAKIRPLTRVFTSAGLTLRVPLSPVAAAGMVAEGAQQAEGTPNPTQVILSKKKAQAHFQASFEMLEDSAFNLVSWLSERAGSAIGALEDVQICTSNGTAPNISDSIVEGLTDVDEATTTVLTYGDIVSLYFAVPEQYHAGAVWMGGSVVMELLSTLVDGNGRPMFIPAGTAAPAAVGNTAGNVGTILGRPVYNVPLADGTLYFGDPMESYGMLDGGGISFRASEHTAWATDSVAWKFTTRFDGAVMTADAARTMTALASVA